MQKKIYIIWKDIMYQFMKYDQIQHSSPIQTTQRQLWSPTSIGKPTGNRKPDLQKESGC